MILVNGVVTPDFPADDRGVAYGDGVFRTLAVRDGRVLAWRPQYAKLASDASALGIACPESGMLRDDLEKALCGEQNCAIKIIITRGSGQRGYAPQGCAAPNRIVARAPLPSYPERYHAKGVTVRICSLRLGWQPALAGVKHLNRLENVLACAEWNDPGIAEGLLLDCAGEVIGGTRSNIFIVEAGALVTPELTRCGVAGVTRQRIIEAGQRHGKACRVERINLERLIAAREVLLVNSLIGAWQIERLGGNTWVRGEAAEMMRRWLAEDE